VMTTEIFQPRRLFAQPETDPFSKHLLRTDDTLTIIIIDAVAVLLSHMYRPDLNMIETGSIISWLDR